ncbi:unnamed protein product [Ostreobium quekettii]|uniref:3'(2'),5'-bisphosphate nucleotidase n=1 Tax=Ostreobium quekettii TaxID=121088 RepID=A0A8S1ILS8_9CHLO|nr:unnamed protein product [Ostreobium quekettii]|eukprot:evm.model.scf_175.2 EVM.evm.TU.scf_175.2   scf_175:7994-16656(+)
MARPCFSSVGPSLLRGSGPPAAGPAACPWRRCPGTGSRLAAAGGAPALESTPSAQEEKELRVACQAVRLAARLCQVVQQELRLSEWEDKDDSSPVTVADYGAQAVVAWVLSKAGLHEGPLSLVAEEDSTSLKNSEGGAMRNRISQLVNEVLIDTPGAPVLTSDDIMDLIDMGRSDGGSGTHWVLDPIDGTRGFVAMRQYSVCLGLLKEGQVTVGALGCPNLPQTKVTDEDGKPGAASRTLDADIGCLFTATRGGGARDGPLWGSELPSHELRVPDVDSIASVQYMESFEKRHSNHELTAALAEKLGIVRPVLRMDSQVKYGALSRGDAALFMRFPPPDYREKIWDHCAGSVIVEEAGAKISDGSGRPLDFSQGRWLDLDRGIIAASPSLHATVLQALNEL